MKTNEMVGEDYSTDRRAEEVFKGLPNYYYAKLAILLCSEEKGFKEFINSFYDINDVTGSLRNYRRFILDYRNEEYKQEYFKLIQDQIYSKNWNNLYITLKQLFLEPFDQWIMDRIVKKIELGLDAENLYNWYILNKNIKSIITFQ